MHARFCERIETALARLQRRIERAQKPIDRGAVERQIGRLLGRNTRAAARYAIRLVDDANLAGWPAARMVERAPNGTTGRVTAKAATCCAPTSARLDARGAVADLHPAYRSGGGLPHPQERAVDPSDLASARGSRAGAYPGLLPRLRAVEDAGAMAEPRRSRQQSAHPPSGTRRHHQHRRHPADGGSTAANCDCAASCAPIAPRRSCSSASVSACPNDSACPPRRAKCSANFGLQVLEITRARPRNCGSWASGELPVTKTQAAAKADPASATALGILRQYLEHAPRDRVVLVKPVQGEARRQ